MRACFTAALVAALLSSLTVSASADPHRYTPGQIKVGQHVMADPMHSNQWQPCTVTKINMSVVDPSTIDTYSIRCGSIDFIAIADSDHIRPGGSGGSHGGSTSGGSTGHSGGGVSHSTPSPGKYHTPESTPPPVGGTLANGTYHCKIGFSIMLTYGDFTISGNSFTFRAPDGTGGSGTYSSGPGGFQWHGNYGTISRPPYVVVASGKDGYVPNTFYFKYRTQSGSQQTMSCRMK